MNAKKLSLWLLVVLTTVLSIISMNISIKAINSPDGFTFLMGLVGFMSSFFGVFLVIKLIIYINKRPKF